MDGNICEMPSWNITRPGAFRRIWRLNPIEFNCVISYVDWLLFKRAQEKNP